jgi:hypothetical protein
MKIMEEEEEEKEEDELTSAVRPGIAAESP